MNKRAFNARAQVGRTLARIARADLNAWVYDQAREYARSGFVGPDLGQWIDWYWGRPQADWLPESPRMGSLALAEKRGWDRRLDEVWKEMQQGLHDTSTGLRPTSVFRDREGAVCVAYPGDRGGKWIGWEQKVSY